MQTKKYIITTVLLLLIPFLSAFGYDNPTLPKLSSTKLNLNDLNDVSVNNPVNDYSLVWSSVNNLWIAKNVSGGGGGSGVSDGNASSICTGNNVYLDGEGNCNYVYDTNRSDNDIINVCSIYNDTGWVLSQEYIKMGDEVDPLYSAWDKDYNDLINTPTIPILWDTTFNNTGDDRWLNNGGNSSFNQSLTDTLYSAIKWGYNQTIETYNLYNNKWSSTYNQTYDNLVSDNSSWNESYANNLYEPKSSSGNTKFKFEGGKLLIKVS